MQTNTDPKYIAVDAALPEMAALASVLYPGERARLLVEPYRGTGSRSTRRGYVTAALLVTGNAARPLGMEAVRENEADAVGAVCAAMRLTVEGRVQILRAEAENLRDRANKADTDADRFAAVLAGSRAE